MTMLEELLLKAKSAADTVGKKTADLTDMVRLKTKAASLQKEIATTLESMGRLVYDNRKAHRDISALLEEHSQKVDGLKAELKAVENELCAYQKVVHCPSCDNKVDDSVAFCPYCGQKMQGEAE